MLSRFIQPDTIVPSPANPQSLNRYSYCYNDPLKFIDPTGQEGEYVDPVWEQEFRDNHGGQDPTAQDVVDRLFSLANAGSGANGSWTADDWDAYSIVGVSPGSGANGSWTQQDWRDFSQVRGLLGQGLLSQIGKGNAGTEHQAEDFLRRILNHANTRGHDRNRYEIQAGSVDAVYQAAIKRGWSMPEPWRFPNARSR